MTQIAMRSTRSLFEGIKLFEEAGGTPSEKADQDAIEAIEHFDRTVLYGRRVKFIESVTDAVCEYLQEMNVGDEEINGPAYGEALDFAARIPTNFPIPEVFVDSDGSISFDWTHSPHHSVVVAFYGVGKIYFAVLQGRTSSLHGTKVVTDELPKEITDSISSTYRL